MRNPFDILIKRLIKNILNRIALAAKGDSQKARRLAFLSLGSVYLAIAGVYTLGIGLVFTQIRGSILAGPDTIDRSGELRHPDYGNTNPGADWAIAEQLTPEQQRAQRQHEAFRQIELETGFAPALISQLFKSPEQLAQLNTIKDLREQFDLDVEGERYLLELMATMREQVNRLNISSNMHFYVHKRVKDLEARVLDDVTSGGLFANQDLRAHWARVVRSTSFPAIPEIDTRPISDAITYREPIRRLDVVKLIILLRATNQALEELDTAHRPLKEFINRLPDAERNANFTEAAITADEGFFSLLGRDSRAIFREDFYQMKARLVRGYNHNPADALEELEKGSMLAYMWAYNHYGIFASFAIKQIDTEYVIAEQEAAAQNLERFLGGASY